MNPCGKFSYPDKRAAKTAANYRLRDHSHKRGKVKLLRVYHCEACQAWHLTHKPDFTADAKRRAHFRHRMITRAPFSNE